MFKKGFKKGMAIALGYFPVSFSFGAMCVNAHMPFGLATIISITNFTSSGQFAGLELMKAQASYIETAITLLLINARYFLMSLSLSQKIEEKMNTLQRMLIAFCISDETYALSSLEEGKISFSWMSGFMLAPFLGWTLGTLCGETVTSLLPTSLQQAMGIALYGMFLAIIVPASKKSKEVAYSVILAALLHTVFTYTLPISSGFKLILATLISSMSIAYFFPREDEV